MKIINIIVGIFYLSFGLFLWNHPLDTLATFSIAFGLMQLAGAIAVLIYSFWKKLTPIPWGTILVSFVIGLGIFFMPLFSLTVILWLFVFSFLAMSAVYLQALMKNKDQKWHMVQMTLAILGIIYSFVMLFNPIAGFATMAKVLAFGIVTNGLSYIFAPSEK